MVGAYGYSLRIFRAYDYAYAYCSHLCFRLRLSRKRLQALPKTQFPFLDLYFESDFSLQESQYRQKLHLNFIRSHNSCNQILTVCCWQTSFEDNLFCEEAKQHLMCVDRWNEIHESNYDKSINSPTGVLLVQLWYFVRYFQLDIDTLLIFCSRS